MDGLISRSPVCGVLRISFAVLLALAAVTAVQAGHCSWDQCDECDLRNCRLSCCYDPPELWLVNTRCVPKCSNLDEGFEHISIKRYDAECRRWVKESYESFLAQEATMPSLIFAHGNTLKHKGAMKQCWEVYNRMKCCPGQKRLVFWSWPAEVVYKRPILMPRQMILDNLHIKFVYSEYQGYYMAKFAHGMSLTQRVTMGGHSYGAIHAAVAAHYLGGGTLRCLSLEGGAPVERPNLRLALVSAAFDNDALYIGHRYGQAFVAAEKVFVTRNRCDSTLDNWDRVSFRGRPALGYTGMNPECLGEYRNKLCQMTTTAEVGKSHYIDPHLQSSRFMAAVCCIAFPKCCELVQSMREGAAPAAEGAAPVAPTPENPPADDQSIAAPVQSAAAAAEAEAKAVALAHELDALELGDDATWIDDADSAEFDEESLDDLDAATAKLP